MSNINTILKSNETIIKDHDIRIQVWKETEEFYKSSPSYESIVYYGRDGKPVISVIETHKDIHTEVKVVNEDCIYAAQKYCKGRTCILNMADWARAGGIVEAGSRAQEEELFRRSNLFKHLHQKYYPMNHYQTIYSRDVEFYRYGRERDYEYMENPVKFDVISAPAICGPHTSADGQYFMDENEVELMLSKIKILFAVAVEQGVQTLVLSAWGCGAFGGPPIHTAQLFNQVLKEYDGAIPSVIFAVLGPNFDEFKNNIGSS